MTEHPERNRLHTVVADGSGLEAAREAIASGLRVDERTNDKFQATALHRAAGHGRVRGMVGLLVEAGADVEARNFKGRTPLHLAYRYDAPQWLIDELREHGANPGTLDDHGLRPEDLLDPQNH